MTDSDPSKSGDEETSGNEAGQLRDPSRRRFIQRSGIMLAGGAIGGSGLDLADAAQLSSVQAPSVHVWGSDTIKIGLIGCGSRGTAAVIEALQTGGGDTELVAMADVFDHQLHRSFRTIKGRHPGKVAVDDARFVGFDGYRHVLQSDADVVILATPPGFRPQHFEATVASGKHVFMEMPVATDAPGVRRVLAANEIAKSMGLAVQVGLQRRHESRYRECIDRLHGGAIGELSFARAYWNAGIDRGGQRSGRKGVDLQTSDHQSELESQLRHWNDFTWLAGDHINQQHVHNLDIINWLVQSVPIEANGLGGRDRRDGDRRSQNFDHHAVEFTYPGGFRLLSQSRRRSGCWNNIGEHAHGTSGTCDISNALIRDFAGKKTWHSEAKEIKGKGWQQEQNDLFAALRRGEVPNEGHYGATSTMTAILGRIATYSGQMVKWDDAFGSRTSLADTDAILSWDDSAPVQPDQQGAYAVAVPGRSSAVV